MSAFTVMLAILNFGCALYGYKRGHYFIAGLCAGYTLVVLAAIVHHGIRGIA